MCASEYFSELTGGEKENDRQICCIPYAKSNDDGTHEAGEKCHKCVE
jgi:hypothetical protein